MAAKEFDRDDKLFLGWTHANDQSYVLNTERSKNPNVMVLHHAWCKKMNQLSKNADPGGFTERDYIKICSPDLASLRDWVRQHGRPDGTFSSEHECYR